MNVIDIYDKYYDYNKIILNTCYYNWFNDPFKIPIFTNNINCMSIDIYEINRIISSKNNYFNIPYAYLLNNIISTDKEIILTVPNNVNKYEISLLTNENKFIIPVYEYIYNSITDIQELNKNKEIYVIYYNRYYTYKVKITMKNYYVKTEVIDVINYGTDWLMNKLTLYMKDHTDNENILDDFKSTISEYLSFFDGCILKTQDMFAETLFKEYINTNVNNDLNKYLIKNSLTCNIIYYINPKDKKLICIKNKAIDKKLNHCYISNKIINNGDKKYDNKVNFVNEYQNNLESALNIIKNKPNVEQIFKRLINNNNNVLNISFFIKIIDNIDTVYICKERYIYTKYFNLVSYLIDNYNAYIKYFNEIIAIDDIEIIYNTTISPIILSDDKENNFIIPDYIIECKKRFDSVIEYSEKITQSELDLNNYLSTHYDEYIDNLKFLLSCNNVYYEYTDNHVRIITNYDDSVYNINDFNLDIYFGNKYRVIPAYYYSDIIDENYIYEYVIDSFSYFYKNPNKNILSLIYKDYKLIAEKNNNVITFKDLQRGTYTELSNITRLYKEFNECFYNLALPKKFSKEYTLIGNGKTNLIKNNYDFIFYSYFN